MYNTFDKKVKFSFQNVNFVVRSYGENWPKEARAMFFFMIIMTEVYSRKKCVLIGKRK